MGVDGDVDDFLPQDEDMPDSLHETSTEKIDFAECPDGGEDETDVENHDRVENAKATRFVGFCRYLSLEASREYAASQSTDDVLPYKTACLRGLKELIVSLPASDVETRKGVHDQIEETLCCLVRSSNSGVIPPPPVIVAGALDCIAACCWMGMDGTAVKDMIQLLTKEVSQSAWTIQEAVCKGLSSLARVCSEEAIRRYCWSTLVDVAKEAQRNRKYWRVR